MLSFELEYLIIPYSKGIYSNCSYKAEKFERHLQDLNAKNFCESFAEAMLSKADAPYINLPKTLKNDKI